MQPGTHIGRVCISVRDKVAEFRAPVADAPMQLRLDAKASYLLVGGLGGIGREVATWMVENGARELVFLSRGAGTKPEHAKFLEELEYLDCKTHVVRGTVTDLRDVKRAMATTSNPLRGILQMSMALHDESFPRMSFEQWQQGVSPKVAGTWNLHDASIDQKLDFFVMFSSISGVIGQPGQGNYASANTFLDAFVQYRQKIGLPATSIDIGAVADIGYVSEDADLMKKLRGTGFLPVRENELLDALMFAMQPQGLSLSSRHAEFSRIQRPSTFLLGFGRSDDQGTNSRGSVWRRDPRMAIYHNTTGQSSEANTPGSTSSLRAYVAKAKADPSVLRTREATTYLATEIGQMICELLLKPKDELNMTLSLTDLGMDSLVGIELRAWWRQTFGFDASVLELLGTGTLEALGQFAADGLAGRDQS